MVLFFNTRNETAVNELFIFANSQYASIKGDQGGGGACPKINKVHGVKDCLFNQATNKVFSQDCNFNIDKACNPKCK